MSGDDHVEDVVSFLKEKGMGFKLNKAGKLQGVDPGTSCYLFFIRNALSEELPYLSVEQLSKVMASDLGAFVPALSLLSDEALQQLINELIICGAEIPNVFRENYSIVKKSIWLQNQERQADSQEFFDAYVSDFLDNAVELIQENIRDHEAEYSYGYCNLAPSTISKLAVNFQNFLSSLFKAKFPAYQKAHFVYVSQYYANPGLEIGAVAILQGLNGDIVNALTKILEDMGYPAKRTSKNKIMKSSSSGGLLSSLSHFRKKSVAKIEKEKKEKSEEERLLEEKALLERLFSETFQAPLQLLANDMKNMQKVNPDKKERYKEIYDVMTKNRDEFNEFMLKQGGKVPEKQKPEKFFKHASVTTAVDDVPSKYKEFLKGLKPKAAVKKKKPKKIFTQFLRYRMNAEHTPKQLATLAVSANQSKLAATRAGKDITIVLDLAANPFFEQNLRKAVGNWGVTIEKPERNTLYMRLPSQDKAKAVYKLLVEPISIVEDASLAPVFA